MLKHDLQLCLVTQIPQQPFPRYKQFVVEMVQSGVTSVQLRAKNASERSITQMAYELKEILTPFNIPLIINDHITIAKEVDAEGVHIGQSDHDPLVTRDYLGPEKWIGLSIETWDELEYANSLTCINYIAASAVFPTLTKRNCKTYWGLAGLRQISARSRHPVVAIGGINLNNIHEVSACGIAGVAVISAIHDAFDPAQTTQSFMRAIRGEQ